MSKVFRTSYGFAGGSSQSRKAMIRDEEKMLNRESKSYEKKEKMAKKFKMGSDRTPAGDGFLAVKKEQQKK